MLPLSHIYVSTETSKRKNDLLAFGSVLPDFSWTSKNEVGRDEIHYSPDEFYEYIKANWPEYTDLGLGAKLHSNIDKSADFYSDDLNEGFAKIEGKLIEKDVANLISEQIGEKTL